MRRGHTSLDLCYKGRGVISACICSDPSQADAQAIRAYTVHDAVRSVSSGKKQHFSAQKSARQRGAYRLRRKGETSSARLRPRGCDGRDRLAGMLRTAEEILEASAPDGIMLSNGPGDPGWRTCSA